MFPDVWDISEFRVPGFQPASLRLYHAACLLYSVIQCHVFSRCGWNDSSPVSRLDVQRWSPTWTMGYVMRPIPICPGVIGHQAYGRATLSAWRGMLGGALVDVPVLPQSITGASGLACKRRLAWP